jgi:hypothetical protein
MFTCQLCGTLAPSRAKSAVVVVETRIKHYPARAKVYRRVGRSEDSCNDPGGIGREAVRSVRACSACAARHVMPDC